MNQLNHLRERSILFLEDNEEFAANTIALLNMFLREVYHATTVEMALEYMQKEAVDIIISDIRIKSQNGLDFISHVRQSDSNIPIIILSGHKDEAFLFRSIPLNLTAYLLKPIKYEELIEALSRCAEKIAIASVRFLELKDGWSFDNEAKIMVNEGKKYSLNKKETLFIEMIVLNRDRLITKEMFQHMVWQEDDMSDSALTNFILRIRRRFGKKFIYTIPDLGYRFKL